MKAALDRLLCSANRRAASDRITRLRPGPDVPRGKHNVVLIPAVPATCPLLDHVVLWRKADFHIHSLEFDNQRFFRSEVANSGLPGSALSRRFSV